jgi:hypothetical protein
MSRHFLYVTIALKILGHDDLRREASIRRLRLTGEGGVTSSARGIERGDERLKRSLGFRLSKRPA